MSGALTLLKRILMYQKNLPELRDSMKHIAGRKPVGGSEQDWNRVTMANELMRNAEDSPNVRTHVFNDRDGNAKGAYQLQHDENGTYLPYMMSDLPGLGREMLEDAYFLAPQKPLSLYAIPGSEGFYRKQPGWVESQEDGISKFSRKAQGGLIQMRKR